MRVVSALRNRKPGSVSGIQSTEISYENGKVETYSLIRGSIVWPFETFPGVTLLGAQKLDSDKVEILEERLFRDMSGAVGIFQELWSYLPSCYYYREDAEGEAFISFLRKSPELTGKLPLASAPHTKALEYGVQLIGKFLKDDCLEIPAESILATQLRESRWDTSAEEIYTVNALRYLLGGIEAYPHEQELQDFSMENCLV
jgi:hypothetical protein